MNRKVTAAAVLTLALATAGCAQQPATDAASNPEPEPTIPDCGATIIYEPDGTSGQATPEEALQLHIDWLKEAVDKEATKEPSEVDWPSKAPELNTAEIALSALERGADGTVERSRDDLGETVTIDAITADGTDAGEVIIEEIPAGFNVSTIIVSSGTTPLPEECGEIAE